MSDACVFVAIVGMFSLAVVAIVFGHSFRSRASREGVEVETNPPQERSEDRYATRSRGKKAKK
jgi:hypothetical protein